MEMVGAIPQECRIVQVYLILDEFLMGGEIQETSKKVGGSGKGLES